MTRPQFDPLGLEDPLPMQDDAQPGVADMLRLYATLVEHNLAEPTTNDELIGATSVRAR